MSDFDRVREIKRAVQERLLALPGVHAVGVGSKIVDGQPTDELAIMVFVVSKKPASELTADELIPEEIDGVKTDVYESGVFRRLADDTTKYRDPLIAGCRITAGGRTPDVRMTDQHGDVTITPGEGLGGIGTLGCFAKTGDAHPKIIALTNWHVLGSTPRGEPTQLTVTISTPTFTFGGSNTTESLVVVSLSISAGAQSIFYTTTSSDTPATIAAAIAARINALGVAGLSATPSGTQVTVTFSGSGRVECAIYGPHTRNTWSQIHASISGTNISLDGQASDACAAWVVLNKGGSDRTFGIFVPIAAGASASTVATAIMSAIGALNLPGVTAIEMDPQTPGGPAIVGITGLQQVECEISSDVRVGQDSNSFCSKCCKCCDDRIGTVIGARFDLDAALIQLDPEYVKTYRAEIADIGVVRGIHDINSEATGYALQKRGQTTQHTTGTLLALDVDGDSTDQDSNQPPNWILYERRFKGAFTIQGNFSAKGDSGSAVLNNNSEVVGLLFGGDSTNTSAATPIQSILSAFPALNLTIETATTAGEDRTVPAVAAPGAHALAAAANADGELPEFLPPHIVRAQQEITATPGGQQYFELVQRHLQEVQTLLNTNRRVAAAWQRNGGPQIVHSFMHVAHLPAQILPEEINGKPLSECLAEIQSVFVRYASPEFAADLEKYGPPLAQFAGLTYPQALDALQRMGGA